MDKIKKVLGFLVFPLLLLLMFFPTGEAHAATDVTDKGKYENLKITGAETGSTSHIIIGPSTKTVELKYSGDFSFPGVQANVIKPGDYFIVKAPENLDLEDKTLDLIDSNSNTKMGTVQVEKANHRLVFTFNEAVQGKQHIRGSFTATAKQTVEGVTKKVTYTLPGGVTQEIEFEVKTYPKHPHTGELIYKQPQNDPKASKIIWNVRINRSKTDMGNHTIKITDNIGLGAFASYIEKSFELSEVVYETTDTNYATMKSRIKEYKITMDPEEYKKDSDNTALLTFVNGKRGFELLMPTNMGTKSFYLRYLTTSPADESEVKNSIQYLRDNEPQLIWKQRGDSINTQTSHDITIKTVKSVGATITADIAGKIKITKFDEADADVKLAGVVFEILRKSDRVKVQEVTTDADGIAVSDHLNDGEYIVKEKTPKPGYQVNSQEFTVEMKDGKGVPLNISNKRVTVDFEATKTWVNGKAIDYKEVKLGLYVHKEGQTVADAKPVTGNYTPEVTVSNGVYTYKWKNQLPERDVDGSKLVYSVRELEDQTGLPLKEGEKVKVGDNSYVVSYNGNNKVTNTYEVPKTNVTANKVWTGGNTNIRPTVYFKLYCTPEGGAIEEVVGVSQKEVPKTDGTVEWTDLPETDEHGVKYTYSVMEVDEDGNLIVDTIDGYTPSQTAPLTITNTYSTSPAKAVIEAKKKLEGRPTELQENEFEFTLTDSNGVVKDTKKNDKDGNVKFKELEFDKAGTYNYTITETNGGQTINGVTYDGRKVPVTVHVVDDGKGKLVASVMYYPITAVALPADDLTSSAPGSNHVPPLAGAVTRATDIGIQTFTNTYKPANVKAPVSATKSFINKNTDKPIQLQGGEFEFALFEKNGTDPIQTTTNDAAGNIKFEDLEFNKADTYHYTIIEKNAGTTDKGITYSNKTIEVTIKVVDNGKGALEATITYDNNDSTFENTYKAENAKAVLEVDKKLSNRNLEADMFEFTLTDQVGNVEKAKNGADGKVKFSELTFDEAGTYTYTIKEVKAGTTENGITYDAKTVTAKVTVTDDGQGKLNATVEYSSDGTANSTTFNNVYTPAGDTSVTLGAKKVLEGKTLEAGKYSFVLKKADGTVVETVTNAADGTVTFSPISYNESQVGTHKYTISEVEGDETGITYDKTVQEVEVTVKKVSATELKATASKEAKDLVFKNIYTPAGATSVTLGAKKVLEGKALEAGKYSFFLKKEDGTVVETVTNAADGTVTFSPISYDESQVGTHKYTISEVAGSETGITYDKTVQEVEVTVEKVSATELKATASKEAKDLKFTNVYTPAGDTSITLGAKKVLEGKTLEAGKYSFVLKEGDKELETVTNATDGTVTFSPISYNESQVGTHKYTISEVAGTETGITYDKTVQEVEVTVEKVSATELKATASKEAKDLVFTNKYTPAGATSVTLGAKKVLEGKDLEAGKYSFVLKKEDGSVVETVTNAADGTVTFSPISYDESQVGTHKYTISEVAGSEVGITYDKTVQEVEVKVEKVSSTELKATASKEAKDLVFTNKYTPAGATTVTLGAKKVLEGKKLEAGKYSFVLKEGDKELETVTNAADGNVTFKALTYNESQVGTHKYTISEVAGSEVGITYDKTVQEVEVTVEKVSATELKATASKEAKDLVFTNKYTPAKTSVSVKKAWDDKDNQDGKRPASVTVKLLADGQDTGKTLELNAANGWAGSFTDLDADKGGTPIQYIVVEVTVPGYTSKVTGDAASGFTITNSYSPETVDVKATKNWDDANNQDGKRPTKITINLLADGQKVDSKEVQAAADGTWTVEFTKLAKYKDGKEIKYTVTEEAVAEYESTITDFTITNKYAPKQIDYKVTKVWKDANNQDGKRPESVTVQLYKKVGNADPVAVEGKKLTLTAKDKTDANTWVASFTNLPQYEAGKEITYSIKEVDVPAGYEASVTGQVVTNTHNPDTVILSGTKVWKDNNNQDGKRTTSVKVQILKNDKEVVQEIEVSEATGWKFESKPLPKYENGKLIEYKVKEVVVKGYTSTITTEKEGKYTITNEYTPEKIAVSGQKTWIDNNDQDRIRPASITVKLIANGKETGQEATATAETGWKYEFTNLDRYQNGKPIEYKVKEVGVPTGYTATETGMNVTNTHTPEKASVKGKKIWKDKDNKDGIRPASITVKLLADGQDTGKTAVASEATGWTYEFTDLDRYKDGQAIEYSVVEVPVDGYTSKVEGFNITNTHTPEKPTPGKPNEPGKPDPKPQLPNTGEKVSNAAVVAGLTLMAVTGGLYFVSRKNK